MQGLEDGFFLLSLFSSSEDSCDISVFSLTLPPPGRLPAAVMVRRRERSGSVSLLQLLLQLLLLLLLLLSLLLLLILNRPFPLNLGVAASATLLFLLAWPPKSTLVMRGSPSHSI